MNQIPILLSSIVSLMGLWCLVVWVYRDYCVDRFRQELFKLRDELFDEARAGRIAFAHPAYGLMRSLMNGFIRFGHRLTVLQLLVGEVIVQPAPSPTFDARLEATTRDLPAPTKEMLQGYLQRLNLSVVEHMVLASPLLLLTIILPIGVVIAVRHYVRRLLRTLRRPIAEIDTIAMTLGEAA